MTNLKWCVLVLALAGCDEPADDVDGTDTDGTELEDTRALRGGVWATAGLGFHDDLCGTLTDGLGGANWELVWLDDETFETSNPADDEAPPRECSLPNGELVCDTSVVEQRVPIGEDTFVTFVTTKDDGLAEVVSSVVFLEYSSVEVVCEGADCGGFGDSVETTFPCTFNIDYRSEWLRALPGE